MDSAVPRLLPCSFLFAESSALFSSTISAFRAAISRLSSVTTELLKDREQDKRGSRNIRESTPRHSSTIVVQPDFTNGAVVVNVSVQPSQVSFPDSASAALQEAYLCCSRLLQSGYACMYTCHRIAMAGKTLGFLFCRFLTLFMKCMGCGGYHLVKIPAGGSDNHCSHPL